MAHFDGPVATDSQASAGATVLVHGLHWRQQYNIGVHVCFVDEDLAINPSQHRSQQRSRSIPLKVDSR